MPAPQTGIFSLGDAAHSYLEFSLVSGADDNAAVRTVADVHEPRTTVGGVNFVAGFRPELWRRVAPDDTPPDLHGFDTELRGAGGYTMPATQADIFLWMAGASYDVVFDLAWEAIDVLKPVARLVREFAGWSYRHSRDLTGFEDGTENPSLLEAADVALVPDGTPGTGGSVLLFQQWRHDGTVFHSLPVAAQERVIGRTKPDSIEFDEAAMPADSHVSRSKLVENGVEFPIFRRNTPYGMVTDHGTLFVGFACEQRRLHRMLERMAGVGDGVRDALTRYTTPLTGAYYFVPSVTSLGRFATPADG